MPDQLAFDALVNSAFLSPDSGGLNYLFKDIGARPSFEDPEQYVQYLEEAGVGRSVVSIMQPEHAAWVGEAHRRFPDRVLPAMIVDPTKGMPELRRVIEYYDRYGVRCLRMPPFRYEKPPTDRIYWPFYAKAIELDIPVSMNIGMPGPRRPGWVQNPIYHDEVAFHWPELRIIMTHVGQPWIDEMISTITHWDNIYLATTSVAPKYWGDAVVQFINTRGRDKVMFGTEFPTIPWQRALSEIAELPIRDEVRPLFLRENAKKVYKWPA